MPRNHIHIKVYMTQEQKEIITQYAIDYEQSASQLILDVLSVSLSNNLINPNKRETMDKEIQGTYGSGLNPCTVLVITQVSGGAWYCVEDSCNVNYTPFDEVLIDGVNVETVEDTDTFVWKTEINTLEELEAAVEA